MIEKLLDLLIEQAHNNQSCYNSVYPWQDIKDFFDNNLQLYHSQNYLIL